MVMSFHYYNQSIPAYIYFEIIDVAIKVASCSL